MTKILTDDNIRPLARLIYLYLLEVKDPKITNSEIAQAFGKSTVTISNCLTELADAGYIQRGTIRYHSERVIKVN